VLIFRYSICEYPALLTSKKNERDNAFFNEHGHMNWEKTPVRSVFESRSGDRLLQAPDWGRITFT
jgi:hypothetical protein